MAIQKWLGYAPLIGALNLAQSKKYESDSHTGAILLF